MSSETRKRMGMLWKQGKAHGDFEKYYLEFKDEIDAEMGKAEEKPAEPIETIVDIKPKKKGRWA